MPSRTATMRLGAGLLVGAGALALTAAIVREPVPEATTFVEPALIETPPSTVATLTSATTTLPDITVPSTIGKAATSALPISPIASQLPPRLSAIPDQRSAATPTGLWIDDIELWAPVAAVGFEPDGQLEIPDETEVGWYRFGASPGQAGSTVLAAHVTWHDSIGPFFKLGELEPGAEVRLDLSDGTTRSYQVIERAQYGKLMLPQQRIWTREGDETLVLITCGGDFNRQIRRFTDNIVIYAVPV